MHGVSVLMAVFCLASFCGAQELVLDPASDEVSGRIGGAIAISCTAMVSDGTDVNLLMWYNPDGEEITATDRMNVHVDDTNPLERVVGLNINSLESTDAGAYACRAVIEGVTLEEVVTLVVHETLTLEAESLQYITPGEDSLIQCFVGSGFPVPDIAWEFENEPIEEGDDRYEFTDDGLIVKNVDATANGTYVCSAGISDQGQDTFSRIVVTFGYPPKITELSDVEAELGEQVVLTCKATGGPNPVVTWISQYHDEDESDEDDDDDEDDDEEDADHSDDEGGDAKSEDSDADDDGGVATSEDGDAADDDGGDDDVNGDDENAGNGEKGADDDDDDDSDANDGDGIDDDGDDDGNGDGDGDNDAEAEAEANPEKKPSSQINSTISAKGEIISQLIIDNVNREGFGEYTCVAENALGRTTAKAKLRASTGTRCALSTYGMLASLLILLRCNFW